MQDTNLRIAPYFDDFDRTKNYQKVLFKPGYSVQTRELNTLQSMMQNQIERFGQHIFKDGSIVIPGNINYRLDHKAVMVQSLINGIPVENYRENLIGKTLSGATSGVKAEVLDTISAAESEKDTITLYVRYSSGGIIEDNVQVDKFKNNEVLIDDESGEAVALTTVENASEYTGSIAYMNSGVFFIRGFFVEVPSQRVLLDQYSNKPTYKVGLQVTESIITAEEDESLFDNAIGTTNYASPGADRLKINATLTKENVLITDSSDFIELLRLEEGELTALVQNSIYDELERNLARRTFDESGSYTKKPYSVKVREALNNGSNGGVYEVNDLVPGDRVIVNEITDSSPENAINGNDYYAVEVSTGKAYVKGFEVTTQKRQYVLVPKPRNTSGLTNQGLLLNIGSYLKIDNSQTIKGSITFNDNLVLKDADDTAIGNARVIGLTGVYRLYVSDLSIKEKLTLTTSTTLEPGDFITGSTSGSTAFIESVSNNDVTIRQSTGSFVTGETLTCSRLLAQGVDVSITSISRPKLENVRKVTTTSGFEALISLDSLPISGSSFTVSSGTSLTGVGTQFLAEISAKSRLVLGDSEVEVDSVTGSTVTLSSSVSNGTYYNASKLVCKLYSSDSGLTTRVSDQRLSKTGGFTHSDLVKQTYTAQSNEIVINTTSGDIIDSNSILATTSASRLTFTPVQDSATANIVALTNLKDSNNNSVSDGTTVNVYYRSNLGNPTIRTKEKKEYKALLVDKIISDQSTSTESEYYGLRFKDKEISLKFPDVIKIHAVHQAIKSADTPDKLFDRVDINDATNIKVGDIFAYGNIRATVVGISGTTLYVKYSDQKIQSGTNLALEVTFLNNEIVIGRYIRSSTYGRYIDITKDFYLQRNDTPEFYRVSKLTRKPTASEPENKIVVLFDYFEHQNLANDFYTVGSYTNVTYGEVPVTYNNQSPLDLLDFRIYATPSPATGTTGDISSPFIETAGNSPFDNYYNTFISNQSIPYPSGSFRLDYEFYLGRVDKVYLTQNNEVKVTRSSDSIQPDSNDNDAIGLHLATIKLKPYLKNTSEAEVTLEKNRGYTMRDIGKLETRLSNVEQYASLSLLESNTINMNILDEDGRNRFKNGFVVDSFTSTTIADLENTDYTASIDLDKNLVRPYPFVNNVGFTYNTDQSNVQKTSSYLTIPFEEVPLATQPYATRVENLTPFLVSSWIGDIEITPKKDIWYDTVREVVEGQSIDLTGPYRTLFDIAVPGGEIWGDWELGAGGSTRGGGGTTITDIRNGTSFDVSNLSFEIESGDTIQSIEDLRFTRSRIIDLRISGLKPNTKHYFSVNEQKYDSIAYPKLLRNLNKVVGTFLVGEKVSLFPIFNDNLARIPTVPLEATLINANLYASTQTLSAIGSYLALGDVTSFDGTELNPTNIGRKFRIVGQTSGATAESGEDLSLYSNEFGELDAFVLIPSQTFETGDIILSTTDRQDGVQIRGFTSSYASGVYYTQGTQLDVTSTITTIDVPEVTANAIQDSRTRFIPDPPPPPPPRRGGGGGRDPIAQTFFVNTVGGVFVTSIDLFFLSKDAIAPVEVDLRTVDNGYPTGTRIPGSLSTVAAKDINVSTDGTVATRFNFSRPVYLTEGTEYAFVAKSSSKNYYIWVSRLSETDVSTGFVVDEQPAVGVLLKSANDSTWIPDQFEDVKFTLNRAQFVTNQTFNAVLNNKPVQYMELIKDPFTFTNNSSTIRVFQPNHCMHDDQNKVRFVEIFSDAPNASLDSQIGSSGTNTLTLRDVDGQVLNPTGILSWTHINGQAVSAENLGYMKIEDEIISYSGISGNQFTGLSRGALNTTIVQHSAGTQVQCFNLNGIRLDQLNKTHTVSNVISLDEYEIIVPNVANSSKKSGGTGIKSSRNIQYEIIYPKFNSLVPTDTEFDISIQTITGTSIGNNTQESFFFRGSETVNNYVENPLTSPRLVLSEPNRVTYSNNVNGSLNTTLSLSTTKDTLSPLIDIDGSSITTISNRINKELNANGSIDLSSELLPTGGKHSAYITKKVVLENSSTSVKVMFDGIRPSVSDIKVFVKIKGDSNYGSFKDMNYIEIPVLSYPTSATEKEYRAFDYEIKGLPEFKEFSVKVVMISDDQSRIPKIKNLRCLALAI